MGGPEVERLIELLSKLPGFGPRSARRAALRMLQQPEARMKPLADALTAAARAVRPCSVCGNLDSRDLRRPGAGPGHDLRRRRRGRPLGARTRGRLSRAVSRARRHPVRARRDRTGRTQHRAPVRPRPRRRRIRGDPRARRHRRWRDDGALARRAPGPARRARQPRRPRHPDRRRARCAGRRHARRRVARPAPGVTAATPPPYRRLMPITRRSLIHHVGRAGGVAAVWHTMSAMGLLPVPAAYAGPPQLAPGNGTRVLILGAGIAGMVAAYELGRAGYDCTILEARARAGGRNWSVRGGDVVQETGGVQPVTWDAAPHLYLNPGPARLPCIHDGILAYCREIGVVLEVMINDNRNALMQDDAAFGGVPQRSRAVINDSRGYVAELAAKATAPLDRNLDEQDLL